MAEPLLRHAEPARDGAACDAIYAPYVARTAISFEDEPPGAAQLAERIATTACDYPWLVLEADGRGDEPPAELRGPQRLDL